MLDSLKEKTGYPIEYWIEIVKKTGLQKHGEMLKFLQTEHGFTHGFANLVALKTREADASSIDDDVLIENQYKGKEHLKPICDKILDIVKSFGNDLEIAPKKSNISLRRKKQFALIQPSTKTRIDLGLKFKSRPFEGRLESSGPFGTMCTHRVIITEHNQVDDELTHLLNDAYLEAI